VSYFDQNFSQATIIGRLAADPVYTPTPKGETAAFNVAVNRRRQQSSGEWAEESEFLAVSTWRVTEGLRARLRKGVAVLVVGELWRRTWKDNNNGWHEETRITANIVQLLPAPAPRMRTEGGEAAAPRTDAAPIEAAGVNVEGGTGAISLADLPFDDADEMPF
jgi:single stranded DNA-binding protein